MSSQSKKDGGNLKLSYPIEIDGKIVDTVAIRRPTVADMLSIQSKGGGPVELELAMVALLTGLHEASLMKLDMQDYQAIQGVLRKFTGAN